MDLQSFFTENKKVAMGFSGGVDSSYLLYAALQSGAQVQPYYVKTAFQPEFEYRDALRLCKELAVPLKVLTMDVLADTAVAANPANRCYYCKRQIFGAIAKAALSDGFTLLIDGTNASDDVADRPGMRALQELQVRSPLRECGLTKAQIRRLSKEAGLFTWDKPAYACLATRVPTGMPITGELLSRVERSENYLMESGFSDFRVRVQSANTAKLQLKQADFEKLLQAREDIYQALHRDFEQVLLDLKLR